MLSNTAHVILGFLQYGPLSGYEIKQKIDVSTRFFFAASYGQIYPELKQLEHSGLVTGTAKARGQRARTEYELTDAGRERLDEWLRSPGVTLEMRDEGLLKLFFSERLSNAEITSRLDEMRLARHAALDRLHAIENTVAKQIGRSEQMTLDYGVALHEFAIAWYERSVAAFDPRDRSKSKGRN